MSLLDLQEVSRIPDSRIPGHWAQCTVGWKRTDKYCHVRQSDIQPRQTMCPRRSCCYKPRRWPFVTIHARCQWMSFLLSERIRFCWTSLCQLTWPYRVTIGGVNGPICHGAGRRNRTISDQVVAIEYIDANGVHKTIVCKEQLKAAAGCFGLLGIVTHITFELGAMIYAVLRPKKIPISLAIPPLSASYVPLALYKNRTHKDIADANADFMCD